MTALERLQTAINEGLASPPSGLSIEEIMHQGFVRRTPILSARPAPDLLCSEYKETDGRQHITRVDEC
jgi:hypothetical protein